MEKLKRPCVSGDKSSLFLPFGGEFGQELFCEVYHAFVISHTKGENWDGTDFKMGVGTLRCWTIFTCVFDYVQKSMAKHVKAVHIKTIYGDEAIYQIVLQLTITEKMVD